MPENNKSDRLYLETIQNSRQFWLESCVALHVKFKNDFELNEDSIVDASNPKYPLWLVGAELNIYDSLINFDKVNHDDTALIYQSEISHDLYRVSYKKLDSFSSQFANAAKKLGIKKGDYVVLSTANMNVESISAYLGLIKMGAVVVCMLPSLQTTEIEARIAQLPEKPKLIITQDFLGAGVTHPLYENFKHSNIDVKRVVVSKFLNKAFDLADGDEDYNDFVKDASDEFTSVSTTPEDKISIIFSSGTTGVPKAVIWRADSFIKAANDARIHLMLKQGDILCWPSNFGWMMGSFDMAATLFNGSTLAVYEGNILRKKFAKFIYDVGVTVLGVVPSFVESWQTTKAFEAHDWRKIRMFCSTGAPSNFDNYEYLSKLLYNANPCEYSGGTEVGGALITCRPDIKAHSSEFNCPAFGTKLYFEPDKEYPSRIVLYVVVSNRNGYVPPMGLTKDGLNFDHEEEYYSENKINERGEFLRKHGDAFKVSGKQKILGTIESIDNFAVTSDGRVDESFNINGNKTSSKELEELINISRERLGITEYIDDFAIVGIRPKNGGQDLVYAFVVLKAAAKADENAISVVLRNMREAIKYRNPLLSKIDEIMVVDLLPRNGSKLRRKDLRKIAEANL